MISHLLFVAELPEEFPFDTIKIDQYFIRDLERDEKSQTIVRSIIAARPRPRHGCYRRRVETAEQAAWLRNEGCDRLQDIFRGAYARGSDSRLSPQNAGHPCGRVFSEDERVNAGNDLVIAL